MTGFVQSIITILLFIFILGALVVIHELGHFVTARLANVRVLEFGVGFPPRAKVLRNKGETVYTLNWLPIGGFVKLEGEDGDAANDPRSFSAQALPTRLWILVAGVAMNVLLAFASSPASPCSATRRSGSQVGGVQPGRRPSRGRRPARRRDRRASTASTTAPSTAVALLDALRGQRRRDRHARHRAASDGADVTRHRHAADPGGDRRRARAPSASAT